MITYDLTRDPATHTTPAHCAPGTVNLSTAVETRWPVLLCREGVYGCYNRRLTASGYKSVHGDGRALDIGVGWTPTAEQVTACIECVNELAAHAPHLGMQQIIFQDRIWTPGGWRTYKNKDHFDHAHVEQTMEAAWTNPLPLGQALEVLVMAPAPTPTPTPPSGDDPVLAFIEVTDAWARFRGTVQRDPLIVFDVEWLSGTRADVYAQYLPHVSLSMAQLADAALLGPLPQGDQVAWTDDHFYQRLPGTKG